MPDVVELLTARAIGRDLTPREGCLVQIVALLGFLLLVYWFFASGLILAIAKPLIDWYVHTIALPAATPTPGR